MRAEMNKQTDGKRQYRLSQFDGPLELLLFLIRKNEVSIYDIPIAEITEQYLDYLKYATAVNLEEYYRVLSHCSNIAVH